MGLWYRRSFADAADAERAVLVDIEVFDNRERLYTAQAYVSPATFESQQPAHTVNKSSGILCPPSASGHGGADGNVRGGNHRKRVKTKR